MPEISVGYGEFFDRVTILMIKSYEFEAIENFGSALLQLLTTARETRLHNITQEVWRLILELRKVNQELWVLEGTVRTMGDVHRLALSDQIRKLNGVRSKLKQEIDAYFTPGNTIEVKEY